MSGGRKGTAILQEPYRPPSFDRPQRPPYCPCGSDPVPARHHRLGADCGGGSGGPGETGPWAPIPGFSGSYSGVPTALSLAWRHWALGSSPVVPGVCMVLPLSLPPGAPDTPGGSRCSRARAAAACSPPGQTTPAILPTPTPRAPLTTLLITVVTTVIVPVAVPQAPDAIAILAGELIFFTLPGGCGHRAVRLLQAQQEAPRTGPAGYSNTAVRDLTQGALSWAHLTKREGERRDKELKTLELMWTWGIIFRWRIPSQQSLMEPAWRHRHSRQSCSSESSSQSLSPSHTQERRMHLPLSQ